MSDRLIAPYANCNATLVEPTPPSPADIIGIKVRVERAFTNGCQSCGGQEAVLEAGRGQTSP